MTYPQGNLFIRGPVGSLECIAKRADGHNRWAVVSHPHPQHGGTMHNKVVYRTAKALFTAEHNVIRYNYRGVGNSDGKYDEGIGEAGDLRAVIDYLETEHGQNEILLAGFSFGSWINARVGCRDPRISRLLHVGLTTSFFELDFLSGCGKPTAVVQGEQDQYGQLSKVVEVVSSMPHARLFRVAGADHFFEGKLDQLELALKEAVHHLKSL